MEKRFNKFYVIFLVVGLALGLLVGMVSSYFRYDYNRIIGRHYEEIIADYGEFDSGNAEFVDEEKRHAYFEYKGHDFYCDNAGTYNAWSLSESGVDMFDNRVYPHIIIEFDSNGIARSITKGYYSYVGG